MRAVAERRVLGGFAAAPGDAFGFGDDLHFWVHASRLVRAVTERLFIRIAAGTPGVPTRLHVHDERFVAGVGEFFIFQLNRSRYERRDSAKI